MSFRELRNFTEIMRGLGYPRKISMDNFRYPNFLLVYDILDWMIQRIDPHVEIPDAIETEQERVAFLKAVAQLAYTKLRIKLNIRKLHGADGHSVRELLKIANLLNDAKKMAESPEFEETSTFSLPTKYQDLKNLRAVASELTTQGAIVYDLLGDELELRKERLFAISQPCDIEEIKRTISQQNEILSEQIANLHEQIDNLEKDEANLAEKISRKKIELERNQKRLNRPNSFRPAFMDEYEILEKELQKLYTKYVERYRNLEFLEHELDRYRKSEEEHIAENNRRLQNMRRQMREEELKILRGEKMGDIEEIEEDQFPESRHQPKTATNKGYHMLQNGREVSIFDSRRRPMERPRAASQKRRPIHNENHLMMERQIIDSKSLYDDDDGEEDSETSEQEESSDADVYHEEYVASGDEAEGEGEESDEEL